MSTAALTFSQASTTIDKLISGDTGAKRPISARQAPTATAPPPLPACTLPPPSQLLAMQQAAKAEAAAQHSHETDSGLGLLKHGATPKEKFFGAVTLVRGLTGKALVDATTYTTSSVREVSFSRDLKLFTDEFGDLVRTGPTALVSCHEGYVMSDGEPHLVDIYVTTTHLCVTGRSLWQVIPLAEIASIYPSVALPTTVTTPFFMHIPDPTVVPSAVQIYVNSKLGPAGSQPLVYQFLRIGHSARHAVASADGDPTLLFYSSLDHTWRSAQHQSTCTTSSSTTETHF